MTSNSQPRQHATIVARADRLARSGKVHAARKLVAAKSVREKYVAPNSPVLMFPFLLIYLALVFIRPQEYVEALQQVPIVMSALILMFLAWLFQRQKEFNASHFGLLAGMMLMMASSVALNGWIGGFVRTIIDFLPVAVLFVITATSRLSVAHYRKIFIVIGVCCTVIAVHCIDQVETGIGWSGAKSIQGRSTYLGFLNDPNDLGLAYLVALPMILYWGFTSRQRWPRVVASIAVGLLLIGVFLTNSRGALVGIGVMISAYAIKKYGFGRSTAVIPVLLMLAAVFAPSRISTISADEESAYGRVDAWYEGFQMFIRSPLWGVGKGNFTDHHVLTAHNSLVLTFAELGLIGYFFWFSMIVITILMLRQIVMVRTTDDAGKPIKAALEIQQLGITLSYSMGAYLISSMFLSRSYVFLLFFLQALAVSLYLTARRGWPDEIEELRFTRLFGWLVLAELVSIIVMYVLTRILL